jgi:hypothetical protein
MIIFILGEALLLGATAGELGSTEVGQHLEALDELSVSGEENRGLLGSDVSS